jgi:hypothetical protein
MTLAGEADDWITITNPNPTVIDLWRVAEDGIGTLQDKLKPYDQLTVPFPHGVAISAEKKVIVICENGEYLWAQHFGAVPQKPDYEQRIQEKKR